MWREEDGRRGPDARNVSSWSMNLSQLTVCCMLRWRLVKTDSSTPGTGSKNRYQAKTDSAKPDPRVQIKSA